MALPLNHLITVIIRSYAPDSVVSSFSGAPSQPRICGAWVEVLPELDGNDETLSMAIAAFATSILDGGPTRRQSSNESFKAYGAALRALHHALRGAQGKRFPDELAAAVMCLLLAEVRRWLLLWPWTTDCSNTLTTMCSACSSSTPCR
jgi:hypothetical protein